MLMFQIVAAITLLTSITSIVIQQYFINGGCVYNSRDCKTPGLQNTNYYISTAFVILLIITLVLTIGA